MRRVPHAQGVTKAIRGVRQATRKALKALNQQAAQRMGRGDYESAEALVARGRDIRQFDGEVDALRKRWREVASSGSAARKGATTPLWQYYQPILHAIVQAGGACPRADIEIAVGRTMSSALLPGDRAMGARGRERWRAMVQRARRPLVAEGWIDRKAGRLWRITDAGRKAAERPLKAPKD